MNNPTHADELDANEIAKNGLMCFKDSDRPCGADCMAFADAPEGPDFQGKQWANCMVLVNSHRTAKHLVILASFGGQLVQKAKTEQADRIRANQPPPPAVK